LENDELKIIPTKRNDIHLAKVWYMKQHIRFLLFIFSLSIGLFAQNFSLSGVVKDIKTGNVLEGAVVFINKNFYTQTNNSGYYAFTNIPNGNYQIKISRFGYKSLDTIIDSGSVQKDFLLEPSLIEYDEVVITTDKIARLLRNSPYSESLIGKREIERQPVISLSDVLKEQPGIALLRDGIWGAEVSIRGLSRENIVTLIDGNRIATSTDIAARLSLIDLSGIERIEVIKGAASSIYGSGATGGIINIITKTPQYNGKFSAKGNFSSAVNTVNNLTSWFGGLDIGETFWSSRLSGSFRKAGNTKTPSGELKNSQFKDYSFTGIVDVKPAANNSFKIDYQLFKAEDVGIPGASLFPGSADVRYPFEKRELISASYQIQNISNTFQKLQFKYAYQQIERDVENIPHTILNLPKTPTSPAKRVSVLKISPNAVHKNNNVQIQGNFLIGENNFIAAGLDYWDRAYAGNREKFQLIETLDSAGNVKSLTNKIIGEKPLPDSRFTSIGFFIQDEFEIIREKCYLSLGARIDKNYVRGASTLNPVYEIVNGVFNPHPAGQKILWQQIKTNEVAASENFGLKYSLYKNLDLTLSLGYSFRSPSLEERFQYIDQGSYVRIGEPLLKPEWGKSVDFGFRFYSSDFKFISSLFYNRFNNLVAEIPGTFDGRNAFIKTNIGVARLYGFEFHTDYNFYDDLLFHCSLSFTKGDDLSSNGNLAGIAPLNGNAGIKFRFAGYFDADISSTIFAAQNSVAPGELSTPGYAYFNFICSTDAYKFGLVDLSISVGVENIFNKEYRDHLATNRGFIKSEPGRNIFLKLLMNGSSD